MTQKDLEDYIFEEYGVKPESQIPLGCINRAFVHSDNKKWFALLMNVPYRSIGIQKNGYVDILNLKCDPVLIKSLIKRRGFQPAYNMNNDEWITVLLDGSVTRNEIEALLAASYDLTKTVLQ